MTQGDQPGIEATCARGVMITSWAFFGLFAGFGAAQSLQSSVNGTLGFINLACLYTFFVIVGLLCPPMISAAAGRFGWRAIFFASGFTYIIMIGSNLDNMVSKEWVQPIANAIVGAGAAFLWTTQNFYFGQCANLAGASAAAAAGTSVTDSVAAMTTKFNSSFFAVFQFSNTASNLVAFGVLLAFKGNDMVKTLLFAVLSSFALLGCLMFCILPDIPQPASAINCPMSPASDRRQDETPSASSALMQLADIRLGLMVPWIITNGMTFAFVNGDYTADVVTPLLGDEYVGLLMTAFFAVDTLFTMGWGQLIAKKALGRRSVFIMTGLCWVAFLLVKMLWTRDPNFEKDDKGEWIAIPGQSVGSLDITLAVLLAMLAGAGDGFWTPGPPAILQSFFAESNLLATMAAYKALQSLGFAIQFILGATLHAYPTLRGAIILVMIALSYASMLSLVCKHPLDPQARDQLTESLNNQATSLPSSPTEAKPGAPTPLTGA